MVDSSCIDISGSEFDEKIESPTFGKLIKYKVRQTINNKTYDTMIHYSRVLEFKSPPVPSQVYSGVTQSMKYWGIPILPICLQYPFCSWFYTSKRIKYSL